MTYLLFTVLQTQHSHKWLPFIEEKAIITLSSSSVNVEDYKKQFKLHALAKNNLFFVSSRG